MGRKRTRPDNPERKYEKISANVSKDAIDRVRWAAAVTRKSIGEIINDLIIDNFNEPPKAENVFKK